MLKDMCRWIIILLSLFLSGCAEIGHYLQLAGGQLEIISKRQPIDELINDPDTDSKLKARLQQVVEARQFAVMELQLPDSGSFQSYVQLDRRYVMWNVFVTEEFSMQPKRWCYLFFGCISYRGYFDKQKALDYAREQSDEGYDTHVAPVAAYSTLGWFDDPLTSTLLRYEPERLAGFIFHELAHERLYVRDDTTFNESFAMTVQHKGMGKWLARQGSQTGLERYMKEQRMDDEFIELLMDYRGQLVALYEKDISDDEKRRQKAALFMQLREDYQKLRDSWGDYTVYDGFFRHRLNNATLSPVGTYHELVNNFSNIYEQRGGFSGFYQEAERIGELPFEQRRKELRKY
ncbi:MAG: aminopeptidase [Gammaproteobacteria bacterium]|nr:MAG: aminopeptidase [Gammaproteobacteria bacterium]